MDLVDGGGVKTIENVRSLEMRVKLMVCASCEWLFDEGNECPKCGFGSYGARYVYGDNCYRYRKTQWPWFDKKMSDYENKLRAEIRQSWKSRDVIGTSDLASSLKLLKRTCRLKRNCEE